MNIGITVIFNHDDGDCQEHLLETNTENLKIEVSEKVDFEDLTMKIQDDDNLINVTHQLLHSASIEIPSRDYWETKCYISKVGEHVIDSDFEENYISDYWTSI